MREMLRRSVALLIVVALLAGSSIAWTSQIRAAEGQLCFNETGKCVNPLFVTYWQEHGGLAVNGYPISDEIVQNLEDGRPYTVQYFERVRMEYHPENAPGNQVLLGQFGRTIRPADPPVPPKEGGEYFGETGHNLQGTFLAYWNTNGGLAQFGYPISEPFEETLDGKPYTVQYFERARFEAHPENAAPYNVLLGQFGRTIFANTSGRTVAQCDSGNLNPDLMMMGAAGAREGTIHLINIANASCALSGAPKVQLLDQSGKPLVVQINGPQGPTQTVGIVGAGRGQFISVPVRWTNYCGPATSQVTILLTMPDGREIRVSKGVSVPPCLGEGQGSTFTYGTFASGPQSEAAGNVVLGYFGAINAKDYRAAYGQLGSALQAQQSYDSFAAGYATTAKVETSEILIGGSTQQGVSYDVRLTITATQTDGATKVFQGTYSVGLENGIWKIVAANVAQQ